MKKIAGIVLTITVLTYIIIHVNPTIDAQSIQNSLNLFLNKALTGLIVKDILLIGMFLVWLNNLLR